jgi:hypothetical protein
MAPARGVAAAGMPAAAAATDAAAARGREPVPVEALLDVAEAATASVRDRDDGFAADAFAGAFGGAPAAEAGKARPVSTFFTGLPLASIAW